MYSVRQRFVNWTLNLYSSSLELASDLKFGFLIEQPFLNDQMKGHVNNFIHFHSGTKSCQVVRNSFCGNGNSEFRSANSKCHSSETKHPSHLKFWIFKALPFHNNVPKRHSYRPDSFWALIVFVSHIQIWSFMASFIYKFRRNWGSWQCYIHGSFIFGKSIMLWGAIFRDGP